MSGAGGQDGGHVQGQGFGQGAAGNLYEGAGIDFGKHEAGSQGLADIAAYHIGVGHAGKHFLGSAQRSPVHDDRQVGLLLQSPPAVKIALDQWIFDIADDRVIFF